jgi:hypothetical protein
VRLLPPKRIEITVVDILCCYPLYIVVVANVTVAGLVIALRNTRLLYPISVATILQAIVRYALRVTASRVVRFALTRPRVNPRALAIKTNVRTMVSVWITLVALDFLCMNTDSRKKEEQHETNYRWTLLTFVHNELPMQQNVLNFASLRKVRVHGSRSFPPSPIPSAFAEAILVPSIWKNVVKYRRQ